MNKELLERIQKEFLIPKIKSVSVISAGNINSTYKLETENGSYILQRINKNVFKNPEEVMQNIRRVSRFLEKKVLDEGGSPEREVLHPVDTLDGTKFFIDDSGEYWRIYDCIENAKTYDSIDSSDIFYKVGGAFGTFQKRLADYPAETLHEAIPNFHNTPERFIAFVRAAIDDNAGRLEAIKGQSEHPLKLAVDKILAMREEIGILDRAKKSGELPIRVTHNDTKINNVMIDNKTGEAICVIDLDTVGPDTALVDFGDAIRSGSNKAGEEPENIEDAAMDLELFEAYTRGYLDETLVVGKDGKVNTDPKVGLTQNEIALLHKAPKILTLELAMRFIGDYLNGDEYFKLKEGQAPDTNLKRGLVQLHLAEDMLEKEGQMKAIVESIVQEKILEQKAVDLVQEDEVR